MFQTVIILGILDPGYQKKHVNIMLSFCNFLAFSGPENKLSIYL